MSHVFKFFFPLIIGLGRISPIYDDQEEAKMICVRHLHRPNSVFLCIFIWYVLNFYLFSILHTFLQNKSVSLHNTTTLLALCMQEHRSV